MDKILNYREKHLLFINIVVFANLQILKLKKIVILRLKKRLTDPKCYDGDIPLKPLSELKTLECWISRLMLDPPFFLISRLNNACSPLVINLQIHYPIGIKDIQF